MSAGFNSKFSIARNRVWYVEDPTSPHPQAKTSYRFATKAITILFTKLRNGVVMNFVGVKHFYFFSSNSSKKRGRMVYSHLWKSRRFYIWKDLQNEFIKRDYSIADSGCCLRRCQRSIFSLIAKSQYQEKWRFAFADIFEAFQHLFFQMHSKVDLPPFRNLQQQIQVHPYFWIC